MRIVAKNLIIFLVFIVLCSSILIYGASSKPETANQPSNISPANEDVSSLYKELITLREHALEENRKHVAAGVTKTEDLLDDEIKAAEARIQFAKFQDKKEIIMKELENLVKVITEMKNSIKLEIKAGTKPQSAIYEIDSRILEIKIRLAKIKSGISEVTSSYSHESELRLRLDIANKITEIKMKNDALSSIASIAARQGNVEIMKNILGQINDIKLKNQTARTCAIQLVQANKTQDALEILYALINDLKLRNEILMHIATMDYEWTN